MFGSADVQSLQGLIDWHAGLATFRIEALESLASINLEIQRSSDYLDDKLRFWRCAVREAEEEIVQAKSDLNRRQMPDFSGRIPDCSVQEEALREVQARLEYALDQVAVVRKWMVHLPREINEVYEGYARRYTTLLEGDVLRALNGLQNQIGSLDAYLQLQVESRAPPPPPPAEPGA